MSGCMNACARVCVCMSVLCIVCTIARLCVFKLFLIKYKCMIILTSHASASAKPPPKRNIIPHGNFDSTDFHFSMPSGYLSTNKC